MAGDLVLITGGTGLIGIKTIHLALKAGYTVRAAVRSQSKGEAILATPTLKADPPGSRLSFVIVPDILKDNAYDEAVRGVKYIIHHASPVTKGDDLTPEQFETHFIEPAVKGTTAILTAANKVPGIKRIVITSSVVAIIPWEDLIMREVDTVFDEKYECPVPTGPYSAPFQAYAASKVKALNATRNFVKDNHTTWDVINIQPGFVIGDDELRTDPATLCESKTVALGLDSALGVDMPRPMPGTSVHVADVSKLHVEALDPKIEGNQNFLATSDGVRGTSWEDAIDIVNRNFPQAVENGILPNNGHAKTKKIKIDASKAEKVFGFKFQSYEEQVKTVVKQYLELSGIPVA
ncbi:hypothetical protein BGZ60DRAFT_421451 [Tricladium varicosporioides]|nr:hypothetical protein BGZ60DRAFT_421451 [Hymenoscyphus varicosporioides]